MATYTIEIKPNQNFPAYINEISSSSDSCESIKTIDVVLVKGNTKYVTIVQSGQGSSYIGNIGYINSTSSYELKIEGKSSVKPTLSGSITLTVKSDLNGIIEDTITFTRSHDGTFCIDNKN